ncbi:MAG TPA: phosphosulfolactate synthase [Casimicrobiaceae bacterium]|nr:phosphosulfolactate synthase [Casimicrobiaceae bacterium]
MAASDTSSTSPFAFVELPAARSQHKPRRTGLTMVADFGLPYRYAEDIFDLAGRYIDLVKIAVGTSRLYEPDVLRRKLDLYRARGARPFLGGQFQEYVYATYGKDALPRFLNEARRVGFETVEISDNCVPLPDAERRDQIRLALDCGLAVFGEVGSKDTKTDAGLLAEQARTCFAAGCELVLIEAAELMHAGEPNRALIVALRNAIDFSKVLIELPGPWISGITLSAIEDMKKFLVREFGPDVNIANVMPNDIMETEALRVGLGVVGPGVTDKVDR